MGEQSVPPHDNNANKDKNNDIGMDSADENELDSDEQDLSPEEFEKLDNQLDALNSALDDIEQKTDDIHAQLLQLLNANREVRQQLQQTNNASNQNLTKK